MTDSFPVYLVTRPDNGQFQGEIAQKSLDELPAGDILIKTDYSSLNYKDALAATGSPGVTRAYPHVPGIDVAGKVMTSSVDHITEGQQVIVTGFDLGVNTWGGFAGFVRVPAEWVVPLPSGLTTREAMILGTAGFTATLCLAALQKQDVTPSSGEILVTGATGGVGSLAVAILATAGYQVVASTGKATEHAYLKKLGATAIIPREELLDTSGKPLLKGRWAGAIDTVGGPILATVLKTSRYGAAIACCGLTAGSDLPTSVLPFILRSTSLLGIDSVAYPLEKRSALWARLADPQGWKPAHLDVLSEETSLADLPSHIKTILNGQMRGRTIVNPWLS